MLVGCLLFCLLCLVLAQPSALAQDVLPSPPTSQAPPSPDSPKVPKTVDVQPVAQDAQIATRLQNILQATQWFENPEVRVREGVVFLDGQTSKIEYIEWASELASNTQGVVAVVNRIELAERSLWNLTPALVETRALWKKTVQGLPFIGFGLIVLVLSWFIARLASHLTHRLFDRRVTTPLLRNVIARTVSILVFLFGFYIVLQVSGLTRIALTLLGGTGVAGLIIGIAFRDIAENFLASILISVRKPFLTGDLIEVAGYLGIVQQVTTRGTLLMAFDGNHIQIPNATVYKSNIINYTANPNRREDFIVGIGYADAIPVAQEVALRVLRNHPAVLQEPEPWVLVESLGAATVNLRIYFWLDGSQHHWLKVKSSVIRLIKRAFQQAGISLPDEAREVIFPNGVPIRRLAAQPEEEKQPKHQRRYGLLTPPAESDLVSTAAEGELHSADQQIQEQARRARCPEEGENLLNT